MEKLTKPEINVIYIMGTGRSGSTVLDTILGNHHEIESTGELTNFTLKRWMFGNTCACGSSVDTCELWKNVLQDWGANIDLTQVDKYIQLQHSIERLRNWYKIKNPKYRSSKSYKEYELWTLSLLTSIKEVSGKKFIVDSSKSPTRALALSFIQGVNLFIIHLIRDGRGVGWSYKKAYKQNLEQGIPVEMKSVPVWRTSIDWLVINSISEKVKKHSNSSNITLHYSELATNPVKVFNEISDMIKFDLGDLGQNLKDGSMMKVGHIIAGNRVRMQGKIRLKPDYEWIEKLTKKDKKVFWLIAGRLAKKYNYDKM